VKITADVGIEGSVEEFAEGHGLILARDAEIRFVG
jgi:hypothetical protein